jgi:uncharacterized protein YkwD
VSPSFRLILTLVLAGSLCAFAHPSPVKVPVAVIRARTALYSPAPSSDLTIDEQRLFDLINDDRAQNGDSTLTLDPLLTQIARSHSHDMASRHYFNHDAPAPLPRTPMDRYLSAIDQAPSYALVGENIYYRSRTQSLAASADQANNAFMHSPEHRANVLGKLFQKVGVGIYRDAAGEYWVTEMFLKETPQS